MIREAMLSSAVQGLIAVVAVALLCRCVPLPSSWQVWLWRAVFLKILLSSFWVAPIPILPDPALALPAEVGAERANTPADRSPRQMPAQSLANPAKPDPLATLWIAGAVGFLMVGIHAGRQTAKQLRAANACNDPRAIQAWIAMGRREPLLVADDIASPLVAGLIRPKAVLPAKWLATASESDLRLALAHEAAHLRRHDLLWMAASRGVQLVFWFLPFLPLAVRRLREATEAACDAEALRTCGASPSRLAELLVALPTGPTSAFSALRMAAADKEALKRRFHAMFHPHPQPRTHVLVPVAVLCALTLVPWRAVAQAPSASSAKESQLRNYGRHLTVLPEVEAEIGVTLEQIGAFTRYSERANRDIRNFGNELQAMGNRGVSNRERESFDRRVRSALFERLDQEAWALYTPAQQKRLLELAIQHLGGMALRYESVQDALKLSQEERRRIADEYAAYHQSEQQRRLPETVWDRPPTPEERRKLAEIARELPDATGQRRRDLTRREWMIRQRFERPRFDYRAMAGDPKVTVLIDQKTGQIVDRDAERRRAEAAKRAMTDRWLGRLTPQRRGRLKELGGRPFNFPPGNLQSWFERRYRTR